MARQTWTIDNSHSAIHFSVRHMVFAKVRGSFRKWSAQVEIDEQKLTDSTVGVEIEVDSIDTGEEKRDGHLKSADFFDAAKFPKITFKSAKLDGSGDTLKVTGDLTVHGVTKPVTLDVERLGTGKDPWGNERAGFHAKGAVDRRDFGLVWNQTLDTGGVLVGDKIDIEIDVEAIKPKA